LTLFSADLRVNYKPQQRGKLADKLPFLHHPFAIYPSALGSARSVDGIFFYLLQNASSV
jgi:hypothetical protein